ncbi:MAG: glycerol-3-phosphate dehydrogenase [Candidatus Cloacimonadota bacterium]|nr:MAG: glycerol-3-phosphate dehydrogenase [Candidatus Cloacimonadota bacterium]
MKIIILGAGNWGTALAICFSERKNVRLWTINKEEADKINKAGMNETFLPGINLPASITAEEKYASPIEEDDIIILAVPSRKIENVALELKEKGVKNNILVNVSKGVKHSSLKTIHEIIREVLPEARFANLSGPTIAREIAEGLPAKAIIASSDVSLLFYLQEHLQNSLLKFEFSRDVDGIELCASLKGLIAIAVGLADGLGYKTNIFGLIMTYGLREFNIVMNFLGVSTDTVYGIAGMGDLITTCLSENSRNRSFGRYLAQGMSRDEALAEVGMVVEGVSMAKTIQKLAKFNLSIPLISCITEIIFDDIDDIRAKLTSTLDKL